MRGRWIVGVVFGLALGVGCSRGGGDVDARVMIDARRSVGRVSPLLLGYNHLWPLGGQGIRGGSPPGWNEEIVGPIRDLGLRLLRYPGGTISHTYRWDRGVGPVEARAPVPIPQFSSFGGGEDLPTYGTDEFLALCEMVGAEPLIVVAFDGGTPEEAAAWVAYLNAKPGDTTLIGGDALGRDWKTAGHWARERARNGRSDPWGVKRFEIGNELDLVRFQRTVEQYCREFLEYGERMRAVDPGIRLGAVGRNELRSPGELDREKGTGLSWNETLFERLGARFDFLCLHFYAEDDGRAEGALDVLADPVLHGARIREIARAARRAIPDHPIEIAVTEHATNLEGAHSQGKAGNATLRAALAVADMIFEMARSDVAIGCIHVLCLTPPSAPIPFQHFASILRIQERTTLAPHYHAVRLLSQALGPERFECRVESPEFVPTFDASLRLPYLSAIATGDGENGSLTLLVLNKHPQEALCVAIEIAGAQGGGATGRMLTGPGPDARNDAQPTVLTRDVSITKVEDRFRVELPPLSLVAIRVGRRTH